MRKSLVLLLPVAFSMLACSKSAPPAGKVVDLDKVCSETDASRVRLTGYLRYRRGLLSFCSTYGGHKTCDLALSTSAQPEPDWDPLHPRTAPEAPSAKLSVPVGSNPGEMDDLPEKFKTSDVRLHLPSNGVAIDGSHITIDGKLSVIPTDPSMPNASGAPKQCFVTVEWASN